MTRTSENRFETRYRVRYHDCGPDLRLDVRAALRFFEELALLQSDSLGVGFEFYHSKNVAWVLSKWDLEFGDMPRLGETVTAMTQPIAYRGFTADRRFAVFAEDGRAVVEGTARWMFLDTSRMRPARIPREIAEAYGMPPPDGPLPPMTEPDPVNREDVITELVTRPDDIDINGHVNNGRYVEWAIGAVRDRIPAPLRLRRLRVHYRLQTLADAALRFVAAIDETEAGLVIRHSMGAGGEIACAMESNWG